MEWVDLFALAVNEENAVRRADGHRADQRGRRHHPGGAAYYVRFVQGADDDGVVEFLLTAAAIGILFKENASISGAEVGCQGEVGSACSMAAGGLARSSADPARWRTRPRSGSSTTSG